MHVHVQGSIHTTIRSFFTPYPMKKLWVKVRICLNHFGHFKFDNCFSNSLVLLSLYEFDCCLIQGAYIHHKEIKAAQGIKITAQVMLVCKLFLQLDKWGDLSFELSTIDAMFLLLRNMVHQNFNLIPLSHYQWRPDLGGSGNIRVWNWNLEFYSAVCLVAKRKSYPHKLIKTKSKNTFLLKHNIHSNY